MSTLNPAVHSLGPLFQFGFLLAIVFRGRDGPLTVVRLESAGSSSCSSWVAVFTVVCVLLPLLGAAAFLPSTLNGDFVYDDKKCVVENRSVSPTLNRGID